jgi:hypothetical protein
VWAKQIGGTLADGGYSIALDSIGNIYITGGFRDTVDFDPGLGIFNFISAGDRDIFILKLDASGNFLWVKQMGGPGDDVGASILVDEYGNIYTVGGFQNIVDFNPDAGVYNLASASVYDIFVHKMSQTYIGIEENIFANSLDIFPNPTSGKITIETKSPIAQSYVLSVKNIQGKEVLSEKVNFADSYSVDVSGLSNGVYILSLQNEKENFVSKVVVQK